eukprot:6469216-Amphidinium_carterae.1
MLGPKLGTPCARCLLLGAIVVGYIVVLINSWRDGEAFRAWVCPANMHSKGCAVLGCGKERGRQCSWGGGHFMCLIPPILKVVAAVLLVADLLPEMCNESPEQGQIIQVTTCFISAVVACLFYKVGFREDLYMGVFCGALAGGVKWLAMLLICNSQYRAAVYSVALDAKRKFFPHGEGTGEYTRCP